MVDDTIHFEQKTFLHEISKGLDLTNVRAWFQHFDQDAVLQPSQTPDSRLSAFVHGTIDMIVGGYASVPPTFRFDVDRIAALQVEVDLSRKQAGCGQTLVNTLAQLGGGPPSLQAYNNFLYRIAAIAEYPRFNCDQPEAFKDIALEVVRSAYDLIGIENLPEDGLIEVTINALLDRWNDETIAFQELQDGYQRALERLVEIEMAAIKDKTPLQILNYYNPTPPHPLTFNPHGAVLEIQNARGSLTSISKRIAQIATLHWRVWAPILYEQPRRQSALVQSQELSPDSEVDLTPAANMLMSEQGSRSNIFKSPSAKSDESSSDEWQSSSSPV